MRMRRNLSIRPWKKHGRFERNSKEECDRSKTLEDLRPHGKLVLALFTAVIMPKRM